MVGAFTAEMVWVSSQLSEWAHNRRAGRFGTARVARVDRWRGDGCAEGRRRRTCPSGSLAREAGADRLVKYFTNAGRCHVLRCGSPALRSGCHALRSGCHTLWLSCVAPVERCGEDIARCGAATEPTDAVPRDAALGEMRHRDERLRVRPTTLLCPRDSSAGLSPVDLSSRGRRHRGRDTAHG